MASNNIIIYMDRVRSSARCGKMCLQVNSLRRFREDKDKNVVRAWHGCNELENL